MSQPIRLALLLGLPLGAVLACKSQGDERREERLLSEAQHGHYGVALEDARRLAEANPGDEHLQALYRDARVAVILDKGREAVFHGELETALALFEQAAALAPEHKSVQEWIGKTRAQLANHWLDVAAERTGPEHLDEAEDAYEKVLEYAPGSEAGRIGLARVLLLKNYRAGMSKSYFNEGLTTFQELQLDQADRNFVISRRYRENEPAAQRKEQVEKMKAEERLAQAQTLEASGRYFAARNEYRLVLLLDPTNAGGRDGLDRMDREVRAARAMAQADMKLRRGDLDQAEATLADAEQLTEAQKDDLSLLQAGIAEKRLNDIYQQALSLTKDYRFPDAIQVYDQLLAIAPDYKDAAVRKKTLEEFIHLAEDLYTKATAAVDDKEAERYLRAIVVVWPEYKDVAQRLSAIEARKPKTVQPAGVPAGGNGGDKGGGAQDQAPAGGGTQDPVGDRKGGGGG